MPGADLNLPGFFGKLPAHGDFVTRRLPPTFVRFWDRWASRHLVPRLADAEALFFLLPGDPPFTGVTVPSADSAGRRFPLTIAAAQPLAPRALPEVAADWYAALADAGREAAAGMLDAAALEARLGTLPVPPLTGPPATRAMLWSAGRPPREADPDAPGAALDVLLGPRAEAG